MSLIKWKKMEQLPTLEKKITLTETLTTIKIVGGLFSLLLLVAILLRVGVNSLRFEIDLFPTDGTLHRSSSEMRNFACGKSSFVMWMLQSFKWNNSIGNGVNLLVLFLFSHVATVCTLKYDTNTGPHKKNVPVIINTNMIQLPWITQERTRACV